MKNRGIQLGDKQPRQRVTVQGGIGTAEEDAFLRDYYKVDGTGWGTPFLMVPEVTNVDRAHLERLAAAVDADVYLSESFPLQTSFWMLRNSHSETLRKSRIAEGRPGSPCVKGYLVSDSEFTERPVCLASRVYQKRKLKRLETAELTPEQRESMRQGILDKACICHDLGAAAKIKLRIDDQVSPTICCGPNIVNFPKVTTLKEMLAHIYGKKALPDNGKRPHMFIREMMLYRDALQKEIAAFEIGLSKRGRAYFAKFRTNIKDAIAYYRSLTDEIAVGDHLFSAPLDQLEQQFEGLFARCSEL